MRPMLLAFLTDPDVKIGLQRHDAARKCRR